MRPLNAARTIQKAWTTTVPQSSGMLTSGRAKLQFTNPTWQRWQEENPLRDKIYQRMAREIDHRGAVTIRPEGSDDPAWRQRYTFELNGRPYYNVAPTSHPERRRLSGPMGTMALSDIKKVLSPTGADYFMGLSRRDPYSKRNWKSRLKSATLNDGRAGVCLMHEGARQGHFDENVPREREYQQAFKMERRVLPSGAIMRTPQPYGRNRVFQNDKLNFFP
jgi:hypothetical protein